LHLRHSRTGVDRGHCRERRFAATWFLQLTGLPVPPRLVRQVPSQRREVALG